MRLEYVPCPASLQQEFAVALAGIAPASCKDIRMPIFLDLSQLQSLSRLRRGLADDRHDLLKFGRASH